MSYTKHKRKIRKPGQRPRGAKWPNDSWGTKRSRTSRRQGTKSKRK